MSEFTVSRVPFGFIENSAHFNSVDFLGYLSFDHKLIFEYAYGKKKILIAFIQTDEFVWTSLPSSTFGGFESNDHTSLEPLIQFIELIESYFLQNTFAKLLKILLPPSSSGYYSPELQFYGLHSRGFKIENCNLSYCLPIKDGVEFDSLVSHGNLKRIRKCIRADLSSHEVSIEKLDIVYKIISLNRQFKGYPMTLSYSQLLQQAKLFQNKFKFFCSKIEGEIIASAIAIKITDKTLYILYWGDISEYRAFSPIVSLCKYIYEYCNQHKIDFLDIGTATLNKEPNFGLIDFKSDLGFEHNLKFTMQKVIKT